MFCCKGIEQIRKRETKELENVSVKRFWVLVTVNLVVVICFRESRMTENEPIYKSSILFLLLNNNKKHDQHISNREKRNRDRKQNFKFS